MDRNELANAIDKAIGTGRQIEEALVYLDSGYAPLNFAVSGRYDGGFPAGKIFEISGGSSTGKTALATKLMVEAQKQGGYAGFVDWEHSFSPDLAEQFGLKVEPGYFAYIDPDTWEEGNDKAIEVGGKVRESGVINKSAPIVIVLDSIAAAIPRSMLYDNKGNRRALEDLNMNDTTALSRVTSTTLKLVKRLAAEYALTLVYLNQTRTKPGVAYGDPTTTPGGSAMEFYADARLRLTRAQIKDKEGDFLGQQINAKAIKSKFTGPFKTCSLRLMFDGEAAYFDVEHSLIEHLKEAKILTSDSGGITWPADGKKYPLKTLVEKVRTEGLVPQLTALLAGA